MAFLGGAGGGGGGAPVVRQLNELGIETEGVKEPFADELVLLRSRFPSFLWLLPVSSSMRCGSFNLDTGNTEVAVVE